MRLWPRKKKAKKLVTIPTTKMIEDLFGYPSMPQIQECHNAGCGCVCIGCPSRGRKTSYWTGGCPLEHDYSQTCTIGIFLTSCNRKTNLLKGTGEKHGKKEIGTSITGIVTIPGDTKKSEGLSGCGH